MKKIISMSILAAICIPLSVRGQSNSDFAIIPEAKDDVSTIVTDIGETGGKVRDKYDETAKDLQKKGKLAEQLASGVMTRDTLLDYIVYLVRFLSQMGIFIGVVMIIYAGYLYATSIFSSANMSKGKAALTNAIIGVLVVSFSYAIMKLLTSAFLS